MTITGYAGEHYRDWPSVLASLSSPFLTVLLFLLIHMPLAERWNFMANSMHPILPISTRSSLFSLLADLQSMSPSFQVLLGLFFFRYTRLIINLIGFSCYKAAPVLQNSIYAAKDVTVIIPTVGPYGGAFAECVQRVNANRPAKVIVVMAGSSRIPGGFLTPSLHGNVETIHVDKPSKRRQICEAVKQVCRMGSTISGLECVIPYAVVAPLTLIF